MAVRTMLNNIENDLEVLHFASYLDPIGMMPDEYEPHFVYYELLPLLSYP
jgi:hypothetical protein